MNRLSSYAQNESGPLSPQDKKQSEEDAVVALLEKIRISKEIESTRLKEKKANSEQANGKPPDGIEPSNEPPSEADATKETQQSDVNGTDTNGDGNEKARGIPAHIKLFEIFYGQVTHLVQAQRLPIQDTIALLVSLANLALNIYPDRLDYLDQVLAYANEKVNQYANSADLHSAPTQANILGLLLAPIKTYLSLFTALALPNFLPLLHAQTYPTRRSVAGEVAQSLLRNRTIISTTANLEGVLEILRVLIREGSQQPAGYPGLAAQRRNAETDETIEEQGWLARIVHLIKGADNDAQFRLLQAANKAFTEGNERIKYTTPALLTQSIKLARSYKRREHYEDNWQSQSSSLYKFMHNAISTLYNRVNSAAELCLRLFVSCGQIADQTGFEEVAYEFFAQAFSIYEESISDSKAQFQAVCIFAGALHQTRGFTGENYDTLITKCALHGSKLLKKPDQCRAVYLASHLWWATDIRARGEEDSKDVSSFHARTNHLIICQLYRDGKRVLECLQRALRVADNCMDSAVSVELFVEILNRYVYYFDQQNEQVKIPAKPFFTLTKLHQVTVKYLNGLIELIHSNLQTYQESSTLEGPKRHFQRTLDVIASREYEDVVTQPT